MTRNSRIYPIIVFDFGGVLFDWNPFYLYRSLFNDDRSAVEDFLAEINFMEWNLQQDKGRSFAEGIAELSQRFPHYKELIAAYDEQWEDTIAGTISETVEILHLLKQKGYPLYGLSNWSAETFHRIRNKFDFLDWFDGIIVSGEVGLAKPDPGIFGILLELVDDSADNCLFIDDSRVNVIAAEELGFKAIHFETPQQLKTELSTRGLLE